MSTKVGLTQPKRTVNAVSMLKRVYSISVWQISFTNFVINWGAMIQWKLERELMHSGRFKLYSNDDLPINIVQFLKHLLSASLSLQQPQMWNDTSGFDTSE